MTNIESKAGSQSERRSEKKEEVVKEEARSAILGFSGTRGPASTRSHPHGNRL